MVKFELRSMYEPFVVAVLSADEIESVLSCIDNSNDNLSVLTLDGRVYRCDSMVLVPSLNPDGTIPWNLKGH